jgi:hypothetical protein
LAAVGISAPSDWSPSRDEDSVIVTLSGRLTSLTVTS